MCIKSKVSEIYVKFIHTFLLYSPNISNSPFLTEAQKMHLTNYMPKM